MHLAMLGLCHPDAPVEVRERAAFSPGALPDALSRLLDAPGVLEGAILSTCNRTEIYVVASEADGVEAMLRRFLLEARSLHPAELDRHGRFHEQDAAVRHLFRVAAGLESQILGEGQILKQIKEAHREGQAFGAVGPLLDGVFRSAIAAGKRARTETELDRGGVSTASAAVELAAKALGSLEGRSAVILGTGKIGGLAAKHLESRALTRITIAGRNLANAASLAGTVNGEAVSFSDLHRALASADLLLCGTGAPHHVLSAADLAQIMADRAGRRLVVVDLSVPRNIDPAAGEVPGLDLYDVDDLESQAGRNMARRQGQVGAAERIVDQELESFREWLKNFHMRPAFTALRAKLETVRDGELQRFWQKHGAQFSEPQQALVERLTESILNKIFHAPVSSLRRMNPLQQHQHVGTLEALFDLEIEDLAEAYRRAAETRRVSPGALRVQASPGG